jgi:nucleoside-diphosphate-sugar epimerase
MAHVLIAGCGYVGSALGVRLAAAGHTVWGLCRRPDVLPSGIHPLVADLTVPQTLQALPPALDFVFYTAAPDGSTDEAYRAAYVDGLGHLLQALSMQGQPLQRVFLTSSTAVYAQSGGEWVDETSPTLPVHFTGARLLEGERLLLNGPSPATVLRLGGIYGPGRTGLINRVRQGAAVCLDGPPIYTNRIHRDDCAGVLYHLMTLPNPHSLYLGVDDDPADQCTVLRWLAAQLGVSPPRIEASADPGRRRRSNKRASNARLVASGYVFRYPSFREGYAALLAADDS